MSSFSQLIKDLQDNLSSKCCGKFNFNVVPNGATNIKLYDRRRDACDEDNGFKWYEIERIHTHNTKDARPTGIVCHKCSNNGKCIVSLRVDKKNTRFAVIGNIEVSNVK